MSDKTGKGEQTMLYMTGAQALAKSLKTIYLQDEVEIDDDLRLVFDYLSTNHINPPEVTKEWIELHLANERGYIPSMRSLGKTHKDICNVRRFDREMRGIQSEYLKYRNGIGSGSEGEKLGKLYCGNSFGFQPIEVTPLMVLDRMYECAGWFNHNLYYQKPTSGHYKGTIRVLSVSGELCEALREKYSGEVVEPSFETGFMFWWKSEMITIRTPLEEEIVKFIQERIE